MRAWGDFPRGNACPPITIQAGKTISRVDEQVRRVSEEQWPLQPLLTGSPQEKEEEKQKRNCSLPIERYGQCQPLGSVDDWRRKIYFSHTVSASEQKEERCVLQMRSHGRVSWASASLLILSLTSDFIQKIWRACSEAVGLQTVCVCSGGALWP